MTDEILIRKLLKAFYRGDTTREEESILQEFLRSENLPQKWNIDRTLFFVLYDAPEVDIPEDITKRLAINLDKYINVKKRPKTRHLFVKAGSVAAAILLLGGIFFFYDRLSSGSDMITDSYSDPREAAVAAKKILTLVSVNLNKGFLPLEKVKESIDITNELLNENLK